MLLFLLHKKLRNYSKPSAVSRTTRSLTPRRAWYRGVGLRVGHDTAESICTPRCQNQTLCCPLGQSGKVVFWVNTSTSMYFGWRDIKILITHKIYYSFFRLRIISTFLYTFLQKKILSKALKIVNMKKNFPTSPAVGLSKTLRYIHEIFHVLFLEILHKLLF